MILVLKFPNTTGITLQVENFQLWKSLVQKCRVFICKLQCKSNLVMAGKCSPVMEVLASMSWGRKGGDLGMEGEVILEGGVREGIVLLSGAFILLIVIQS